MTDSNANAWVTSTHAPMSFPEFVVIVGAIIWALGGFTNNPHRAASGKTTVLWSLVAAIVIGASGFVVGWAHDQGTTIG